MGDSDILNYQPGQTVTFYKEVKDGYGQRTDDGYIPVITRVVLPGFVLATGYPQNMSRLDVGLYFFQLVIPQGAGAVGTYLVDIVSLDPNSLLLVNDSRQIVVTAPYGNYSTSTIGNGGPSGLPGPPGPMGPQGPPGPYGTAGGDLSGTYPNPKVIAIQGQAISTNTPDDGYVLTWSSTDGYWQAESTSHINKTLAQTDWYVDWVNGNDLNDGLTPATAVKTIMTGIVDNKWGTNQPNLPNGTTIHLLSSQPNGAEYINLYPRCEYGNFAIVGTPTLVGNVTLGVVTAKNRAANQSLAIAGFTGKNAGQLIVNTTRGNSTSIIYSIAGDVASLLQPVAPMTLGSSTAYFPVPALHDDWTAGDVVQVYDLPHINLVDISCRGSRINVAETNGAILWLEKLYVPDDSGITPGSGLLAPEFTGGYVVVYNCTTEPAVQTQNTSFFNTFVNSWLQQGYQFQSTQFAASCISGYGGQFELVNWLEGDTIINAGSAATGLLYCECVAIQGPGSLIMHPGSSMEIRSLDYGFVGTLYGTGTLSLQSGSQIVRRLPTTSWATCLYMTTLKLPSNATTGTAYSAGVFTDGIALTSANLDTHHGLMDVRTGARFCEDL